MHKIRALHYAGSVNMDALEQEALENLLRPFAQGAARTARCMELPTRTEWPERMPASLYRVNWVQLLKVRVQEARQLLCPGHCIYPGKAQQQQLQSSERGAWHLTCMCTS